MLALLLAALAYAICIRVTARNVANNESESHWVRTGSKWFWSHGQHHSQSRVSLDLRSTLFSNMARRLVTSVFSSLILNAL